MNSVILTAILVQVYIGGSLADEENTLNLLTTKTNVAVQTNVPDLTAVTACLWVKSNTANSKTTLVSYCVSGSDCNELLLYSASSLRLFVRDKDVKTNLAVNDGAWHHVCGTWSSTAGNWAYFHNGQLYISGSGLSAGSSIRTGGALMLGQDQDKKPRGGLDASQALVGSITAFNMWSRALSAVQIAEVAKDCSIGGDIFTWNTGELDLSVNTELVSTDICSTGIPSRGNGNTLNLLTAVTDVTVQTTIPDLTAVTACLWVKSNADTDKATLVSYCTRDGCNEFMLYDASSLMLFVREKNVKTNLAVTDGAWHHVCGTWSSSGGNWAYYHNGQLYLSGSGLSAGSSIRAGGILVLGQDQDSLRGGFDKKQAFVGSITEYNMWSRSLSAGEIAGVAKDCSTEGDVFTWNTADVYNSVNTELVTSDVCSITSTGGNGNTLNLLTTETDVAVLTTVPDLTAITACLWVKSNAINAKATLVSYCVSGSNCNEFLLHDASSLRLYVRDKSEKTNLSVNDGSWHHVCGTWSSSDGNWAYYHNGDLHASGRGLADGKVIRTGGVLMLGQDQDGSPRNGLDLKQAFVGSMTEFNMWSRALTSEEVAVVATDCSSGGDVFTWNTEDLYVSANTEFVTGDVCPNKITTLAPKVPTLAPKVPTLAPEVPATTTIPTLPPCEFPPMQNVAQGKSAAQSSDKPRRDASADNAVDGNYNSDATTGSCSWTSNEFQPWWKLDLGQQFGIYKVVITNRQDCCPSRMKNAEIRVGDSANFADNPVCGRMIIGKMSREQPIHVRCGCETPMYGRYVSIQLIDKDQQLHMCEVEVMAGIN